MCQHHLNPTVKGLNSVTLMTTHFHRNVESTPYLKSNVCKGGFGKEGKNIKHILPKKKKLLLTERIGID